MKKPEKIIPIITILIMLAIVVFYMQKGGFSKKIKEIKDSVVIELKNAKQ